MRGLILSVPDTAFQVVLPRFLGDRLPRANNSQVDVRVTSAGTPAIGGPTYRLKERWQIEAPCSEEDFFTLKLMREEIDHRRRERLEQPYILLDDYTEQFEERLPRTRALATDATETLRPIGTPTHVLYYARFRVWMPRKPEFQPLGRGYGATFELQELDVEPAA